MAASANKEWIVKHGGLALGEHNYDFELKDTFFEGLDYSEIKQGSIKVKLLLIKRSNLLELHFVINGLVGVICDRCADALDLPIEAKNKLIVKIGDNDQGDTDDDIIIISTKDHSIDLSQYLYEYTMLALPAKREHNNEADCNQEVIQRLKTYLIDEEITEDNEQETDPRWDGIKNVNLN